MLRLSGKYIAIAFLFFLCMETDFYAQSGKKKVFRLIEKGNKQLGIGDFWGASQYYYDAYLIDSTDKEVNYKLGICYFNIERLKENSLRYFEKSVGYDVDEVFYYLAVNYQMREKNEKAIEYYKKYQERNYGKEFSIESIDNEIRKCAYAIRTKKLPLENVKIENMGSKINSQHSEYAPFIPADESFMVFTSKRPASTGGKKNIQGDYFEDIYFVTYTDSGWGTPAGISSNINTSGNDACTSISADGQKILIYRSNDSLKSGGFYISNFENGAWTVPSVFNLDINSKNFVETSACFAPDGEIIFFSSDRPGGYGGKDIYIIKMLPNGKWGIPYNAGNIINTPYDEDAPFVHPKNDILFFSSRGHDENMGGYDIFKCGYKADSVSFSIPWNIGYPINTSNDDIFFVLNTNETAGYFSSKREGGYGQSDIYKVSFLSEEAEKNKVIKCELLTPQGETIGGAKILLKETATNKEVGRYLSNKTTGRFILIISPGIEYEIMIEAKDYELFHTKFLPGEKDSIKFELQPIK